MSAQNTPLIFCMGEMIRPRASHVMVFAFDDLMSAIAVSQPCPRARFVCVARMTRRKLAFTESDIPTLIPDHRHEVYGVVWEVEEASLPALDLTMGCPSVRRRKGAIVRSPDDQMICVAHYLSREKKCDTPTEQVVLRLVETARRQGLPRTYVRELVAQIGHSIH